MQHAFHRLIVSGWLGLFGLLNMSSLLDHGFVYDPEHRFALLLVSRLCVRVGVDGKPVHMVLAILGLRVVLDGALGFLLLAEADMLEVLKRGRVLRGDLEVVRRSFGEREGA